MYREVFLRSPLPEYRGSRREVVRGFLENAAREEKDRIDDRLGWASMALAGMTFYAPFDEQWEVILELIELAPDNEQVLQIIAAGPLEGFLGRFDADVIELVEREAARDSKFRRVLSGVWQHRMSDDMWARIRAIQATEPNPLPEMKPFK